MGPSALPVLLRYAAVNAWETPHTLALIDLALEEDLGRGDVTSVVTLPAEQQLKGAFVARQQMVVAGLPLVAQVCARVSREIQFDALVPDGAAVKPNTPLATLAGPARAVLAAERTALNFLQRLSGVASLTATFVAAAKAGGARIVDTRKTTPGYRALEKYAVRMGGASNHRADLGSGVLIKDNHVAAVGSLLQAVQRARQQAPHGLKIEVEVDGLEQFDEALQAGADIVLLDNFTLAQVHEAVARRKRAGAAVLLEVSGGVTLATVAELASTGVDLISVGALTHSAPAVDVGLDFVG